MITCAVVSPIAALLVLGGAAWGLWVATVLDRKRPRQRMGLILLGVSMPPALFGFFAGMRAFGVALKETPPELYFYCALSVSCSIICLLLLIYAFLQNDAARNAEAAAPNESPPTNPPGAQESGTGDRTQAEGRTGT